MGSAVKYEHSIERSTELLRMALPLMSRQAAALHPVSYAVWYEYVAGENPTLRAAMDRTLASDGALDEAAVHTLYRRHVAEVDPQTAQRVADGFQRVLTGMAESAALAGDQTARFGSSLSRLSEQLGESESTPALQEVMHGTREMQQAMARLQQRLDDSRREIAMLRDEVRRVRHESLIDGLTGLANRRAFDQRLATLLAIAQVADPAADRQPCLLLMDIDHFKRINDSYGHAFGDQVIQAVAQVLQRHVPAAGLAARIGGEEFALLLPPTSVDEAGRLAEKVRATIAGSRIRRQGAGDPLERVTVSLGVAPYRRGESPREFVDRADQALYASKSAGRDRVTVLGAA
ncbi:MAG: GGDEF domain-containing protein [Burkholderiaceae bacterium]|nr:GGDEF domain-containing protein [Burkholderiaceae bacterium]